MIQDHHLKLKKYLDQAVADFPFGLPPCHVVESEQSDDCAYQSYSEGFWFSIGQLLGEDVQVGGYIDVEQTDDVISVQASFIFSTEPVDRLANALLSDAIIFNYDLENRTWNWYLD